MAAVPAAQAPAAPAADNPTRVIATEATEAAGSAGRAVRAQASARRFTWVLLLRVVVTTLLFVAAVVTYQAGTESVMMSWGPRVFVAIGVNYGLSLVWALALRRGARAGRVAGLQAAVDVVIVTLLVHADGGADSGFVLLYLLVTVGAAMVLGAAATAVMSAAVTVSYVAVAVITRLGATGVAAVVGDGAPLGPNAFAFTVAKNVVFILATAALTRRLIGELERAGEHIAAQGLRIDALATLHDDVVRSLTSGLLTLGTDASVLSLNRAGAEILGLAAASALGRPLAEVLPDLAAYVLAHPAGDALKRGELDLRRPDGEACHIGISIAPLVDAAGGLSGRIVNFQDLTELRQARERVERAERLAAVGRLAAGVAHEIRNPLAAISGSVELLHASIPDGDADARELMDIVMREVDRLNRLITDMLEFARPRAPETSPIELGAALHELVRVIDNDRRIAPQPGRVRVHALADEPVWVDADPGQLRQVLLNLVINAADATPAELSIDVRARVEAAPTGGSGGGSACIDIRDRGPGIAPALRARVFELFFSTKRGGTGLGLPTVHRIVEEHHGSITIDDAPGGGALVTVRLPRRDPPPVG